MLKALDRVEDVIQNGAMCEPKALGAEETDSKGELSPEDRAAYRDRLLNTVERMELEYDKALLVLHPLGISVTSALFVALLNSGSIIHHRNYLFGSWFIWMAGVVFTLASFVLSARLHKAACAQWEENNDPDKDPTVKCLGFWTGLATYGSGILFVIGIFLASVFLILFPMKKQTDRAIKRGDYIEKGNSLPPSPKPMKTSTTPKPQPTPQKDTPKK